MKTTYSHAAPFIRERLCRAVHRGRTASLKREQSAAFSQALGYAQALLIMASSDDQTPVEGIADEEHLPQDAVKMAREWLNFDADTVFGTVSARVIPNPDLPLPVRLDIPRDPRS